MSMTKKVSKKRPKKAEVEIELTLLELRVCNAETGEPEEPEDIHEFLLEFKDDLDLDDLNLLLSQCRKPAEIVEVGEDDEDFETDAAELLTQFDEGDE